MTRRYTSGFDILGFDTDPTPGDPDLIMSQIVPTYQSIGDDAQAAVSVLNNIELESGAGQSMQTLQNLIGTSFPPKLQMAADSYHTAASIYSTYAQALTEAQNQLDQAMDQAMQVAALANSTVPPAPPNASADQVAAVQQQQQSVDQANDQMNAATRLAKDAQDMRNQAGNTFNTKLADVSAIPDLSAWQKFLNWFEHCPIFQIIIDVAIALVSIFFPVVGLVLGALAFAAFTTFNSLATGHVDWGAIAVGVLTLAFGGAVAGGVFKTAEFFAWIAGPIAKAGKGIGSFFNFGSGTALKGITDSVSAVTDALPKSVISFAKNAGGNFAYDSVTGLASNGIGDAIDHKQFTGQDAGAIVAGAAAGGIVAGAVGAAKTAFGFDPMTPSPGSSEPADTAPAPDADPGQAPPPVPPKTPNGPRPMTSPTASGAEEKPLPPTPSAQTPGSPVDPSYPNLSHPQAPADPPPLQPDPAGQQPPAAAPSSGPDPTIGNAFNQAGRLGNDVASGGVQIAVGQAIGNTTGAQQDPPGVQSGQDAVSDLPALADGSNLNVGDVIGGLSAPFKGE